MGDALLAIESVVELGEQGVACVVRCVSGEVRVGDSASLDLTGASSDSIAGGENISLRVQRILRYEREVELLDAPHAAKVELVGTRASRVEHATHLRVVNR